MWKRPKPELEATLNQEWYSAESVSPLRAAKQESAEGAKNFREWQGLRLEEQRKKEIGRSMPSTVKFVPARLVVVVVVLQAQLGQYK
eukprot:1928757-Rhodomonas_salina.1